MRYEVLATLGRLCDANLKDHTLRCAFAAGDIRAHGEFMLEELPPDLHQGLGVFLYDDFEVASLRFAVDAINTFFDGGHWFGSLIPRGDDPIWERLIATCETAKQALISNGMPAYNEDLSYRHR
ncbi:MAG: hypothetical protein P4L46_12100 [Fimbriimonas sp.]|nr:hypothetical protein [Fimbriimonas sp.]